MSGQFSKMIKLGLLQSGKTVKLSRADIIDFVINLYNIKKKVNANEYKKIYELYMEIRNDNEMISMDLEVYKKVVNDMKNSFNAITPIEFNKDGN